MEIWYSITGEIEQNTLKDFVSWTNAQVYNSQISKLVVLISSIGGDIDSAIGIYHYLKALPFEVETVGFGKVASAANYIYLAGVHRKAVKDCTFLLHEGIYHMHQSSAPLHLHEETLVSLKALLHRCVEILSVETGKPYDQVKEVLREQKILNTEEAKEFGLVQEIIEKLPLSQQVGK